MDADDVSRNINIVSIKLTRFILPYILGNDVNLSGKDFQQYLYEIDKEVDLFLKSNTSFWQKIASQLKGGKTAKEILDVGIGLLQLGGTFFGGIPNAALWAAYSGNQAFWKLFDKVQNDRLRRIKEDGITTLYPQIWNRVTDKQRPTIKDISALNTLKPKRQLIVFYEQPNRNSKLLVQSLIGVELPEVPPTGKCYYFSSLRVSDLLKRQSRECKEPKLRSGMPDKIDFLYLGCVSNDELLKITVQFSPTAFWVTSQLVDGEGQLELQVSSKGCPNLYCFVLSDTFYDSCCAISLHPFLQELNETTLKYRSSQSTDQTCFYLPVQASSYVFESTRPRTNVSVRYCCRFLLGDDKVRSLY